MGRLKPELLRRAERFADRILDMTEVLERQGRSVRLIGQIAAAGTSVGANLFEADEAMSRADFCKCLSISVKELSESRYWIRLVGRRNWISPKRLAHLEVESVELKKILGTMIRKTKHSAAQTSQGLVPRLPLL